MTFMFNLFLFIIINDSTIYTKKEFNTRRVVYIDKMK